MYCHPQTDCFIVSQLFSVARHVGHLKLGSKPAQLYVRLNIIPLSQRKNHELKGNISSSSSCRAISTDIPDPLSLPLLIVHCFR